MNHREDSDIQVDEFKFKIIPSESMSRPKALHWPIKNIGTLSWIDLLTRTAVSIPISFVRVPTSTSSKNLKLLLFVYDQTVLPSSQAWTLFPLF